MKENEKLCGWESKLKDSHVLNYENSLWGDTDLFCKIFVRKKRHHEDSKKMKSLETSRFKQNALVRYTDGINRIKNSKKHQMAFKSFFHFQE